MINLILVLSHNFLHIAIEYGDNMKYNTLIIFSNFVICFHRFLIIFTTKNYGPENMY